MVRRKLDEQELMVATEKLLLEKGYKGFNFLSLASRLEVGRSTLYDYYSSKEELITTYMERVMNKVIEECEELDLHKSPEDQLQQIIEIFANYSQVHQIAQIIPLMQGETSDDLKESLGRLMDQHHKIVAVIIRIIEQGKAEGSFRNDISTPILAVLLFNFVKAPDFLKVEDKVWGQISADVILNGLKKL